MKLLLFPLIFLMVFAFLSQLGIGESEWDMDFTLGSVRGDAGYFDSQNHLVAYGNLTIANVTESATLEMRMTNVSPSSWQEVPIYRNITGDYVVYDSEGSAMTPNNIRGIVNGSILGSVGFMGLITGAIIFAGIAGARIVGSGVSEESVSAIWKGGVLLAIWGLLSILSLNFIAGASFLGPFFWLFLTFIYTMGIINQVGHPGED